MSADQKRQAHTTACKADKGFVGSCKGKRRTSQETVGVNPEDNETVKRKARVCSKTKLTSKKHPTTR
ncbi:hypothetical protein [Nitrosopumilus ureiphilus]|uniref:Uncharacterized protein n=1 Tax=Nitrosopumilus ureiphilus TaxID=1470067 RepID=A0A7D5M5T9_9ARCH|nr:hypothetical protein [Nitrosopumilus ureiphilus]QLH07135.1 hypothetical protein C5F50_08655 [Nitrosopumilus ureiphilus]